MRVGDRAGAAPANRTPQFPTQGRSEAGAWMNKTNPPPEGPWVWKSPSTFLLHISRYNLEVAA